MDDRGVPVVHPPSCTGSAVQAFCVVPAPEPAPAPSPAAGPISASDDEVAEMRKNFQTVADAYLTSSVKTTCSRDMRDRFPACHQLGTMWCWATAVAAATEYYTSRSESKCVGLECEIVGWTFSKQCCPDVPGTLVESIPSACGDKGAGWAKVQQAVNHFTGKSWERPNGPLDKATLDATLQSGNPVIMMIGPEENPTHVVTVSTQATLQLLVISRPL